MRSNLIIIDYLVISIGIHLLTEFGLEYVVKGALISQDEDEKIKGTISSKPTIKSGLYLNYSRPVHMVIQENVWHGSIRKKRSSYFPKSPVSMIQKLPTTFKPECIYQLPNEVDIPCLIKPRLKNINSQTVKDIEQSSTHYNVTLEAMLHNVVYLPCGTLRELQNETVIWEHNSRTISVKGTLFTTNIRVDTVGINNKLMQCRTDVESGNYFTRSRSEIDAADILEMWELVITDLRPEDSGFYICRLTGKFQQNLQYRLILKDQTLKDGSVKNGKVTIFAPLFARQGSPVSFVCSIQATQHASSRRLIDWFRAIKLKESEHLQNSTPAQQQLRFPFRTENMKIVESQSWNNITLYNQIVGERMEQMRLEAVLVIKNVDFKHTSVYQCQAHDILPNNRARLYDTKSFQFTVLRRWHYLEYLENYLLCRVKDIKGKPTSFIDTGLNLIII